MMAQMQPLRYQQYMDVIADNMMDLLVMYYSSPSRGWEGPDCDEDHQTSSECTSQQVTIVFPVEPI